jgi:ABC-type antimicrobial peptide transport system permease subunit
MSWQTLLSVIAASVGFVSGIWLCFGAALVTPERIVKADDQSWKAEPDIAGALISQSAEYLAGGLLLVFAFGLQIAAALAPTANLQVQCQELLSGWVVALVSVLASALISYPIYVSRKTLLSNKVKAIKEQPK